MWRPKWLRGSPLLGATALAAPAWAVDATGLAGETAPHLDQTHTVFGISALVLFVLAYALVMLEERLHLRKSKPVLLAAGLIWCLIAWHAHDVPAQSVLVAAAFEHIFLEFASLFFFLIVAMTYVGAMSERGVFEALRSWLVTRGFGYRSLFWITGVLAFFLSPVLDNLTTALIMGSVVMAVGAGNKRFVSLSFINLVVAANAGGAWSAFGDITTLMVWQAHKAEFFEFFRIFLPSLVNWLIPALLMFFALPKGRPEGVRKSAPIRDGGLLTCVLFGVTIGFTVVGKQFLHMPPVFGMMTGLALLQAQAYFIGRRELAFVESGFDARSIGPDRHDAKHDDKDSHRADATDTGGTAASVNNPNYSIFEILARAEWDTLLFFYGVLVAVGGLATLGYLHLASEHLYGAMGVTGANVALGVASAIVDNIPIMYAVLQMNPVMDHGQWLLITLTTGTGGSLLSVGSAAGVALMGTARGQYTFGSHLRWTWAIALGYAASVAVHLLVNAHHFETLAK
ncbi:MAG: sodium:proton antiporter NhaD [Lysobacteraceae bacterium]